MDIIIKTRSTEVVSIHVRSPGFNPPPGGDNDDYRVVHVLDVPDDISISDVIDAYKALDLSVPRMVWSWPEVLRRDPPGRALSLEEAGALVGQSAYTIKRAILDLKLPSFRPRMGRRGARPYQVNERDLRWYMETVRVPSGRPRKPDLDMVDTRIPLRHLRAKDAARYLGVSKATLWKYVKEGVISPGIKLFANCTVWRIEDLDRFILDAERRAAEPGGAPRRRPGRSPKS